MVTYEKKGTLQNGQHVVHYTIENSKGTKVVISSLGATVVSLFVKNSDGELLDVVLGYDTIQEYLDDEPNFGTIVGRNCNRIANARFELNGKEYVLTQNDGTNNLHSGMDYYKLRVYKVQVVGDNSIVFSLFSPDGDQGFPGNLDFKVKYTLTEENGLLIEYEAVSDADTVVNPTSHGYFNLSGHASGEKAAMSHVLQLFSDSITPMGAASIPTGEYRPVKDTPFDFNTPHALCERIYP